MQIEGILPRVVFPLDGLSIKDNGGTRSGRDRRKLTIVPRNPERRGETDRRKGPKYRGELAVERRDTFKI